MLEVQNLRKPSPAIPLQVHTVAPEHAPMDPTLQQLTGALEQHEESSSKEADATAVLVLTEAPMHEDLLQLLLFRLLLLQTAKD